MYSRGKINIHLLNICLHVDDITVSVYYRAKVENLLEEYWMRGFTVHNYPLENEQVPSMETCLELLVNLYSSLYSSLKRGNKVAIQ